MKLSDLSKATKTITMPVGDDSITLTFKSDFYTAEFEAELLSMQNSDKPMAMNSVLLSKAVLSWDITDEDGNELPVSEDVCKQLGANIVSTILKTIADESSPKKVN